MADPHVDADTELLTPHGDADAALLTPPGRGAVATIRVRGRRGRPPGRLNGLCHLTNRQPVTELPVGVIRLGRWGRQDTGEDVVVCRCSLESIEIHCHGGDAAAQRILSDLNQSGCPTVPWRWHCADVLEAECAEALARATTARTADILAEQAGGLLRRSLEIIRESLSGIAPRDAQPLLDKLLSWADFGRHLHLPWNVVLTGLPNVGKSSLINALLGYERAIVWDQPGTTRDVVTAQTALDGWPVLLADTAGLRDAVDPLEAEGIERATRQAEIADLRLVLIDLGEPPRTDDLALLARWPDALIIAHKADRPDQWQGRIPAAALRVSSRTRDGIPALEQAMVSRLVPRVPPPGTAVPVGDIARRLAGLRNSLDAGNITESREQMDRIFGPPDATDE